MLLPYESTLALGQKRCAVFMQCAKPGLLVSDLSRWGSPIIHIAVKAPDSARLSSVAGLALGVQITYAKIHLSRV